ncbi:hypothetical protein [Kibdelosporangium philippinense]|uniref:hypothetical protein n=1 Tax=Kibdelosporangium philippinense TaxID=211113 RepID=UPI00360A0961
MKVTFTAQQKPTITVSHHPNRHESAGSAWPSPHSPTGPAKWPANAHCGHLNTF